MSVWRASMRTDGSCWRSVLSFRFLLLTRRWPGSCRGSGRADLCPSPFTGLLLELRCWCTRWAADPSDFHDDRKNERPFGGLLIEILLQILSDFFLDDGVVSAFFDRGAVHRVDHQLSTFRE